MVNPKQQGAIRWLISCDESGTGGAPYYGFGSLWMKYQRRGDFARDIRLLREKYNYTYEIKWNKTNQMRYRNFYKELIEYFFKRHWLAFHCFVIRKAVIDKIFHDGDYDLARRKQFTKLIANKISKCIKKNPKRIHEFTIWVDPIASRYKKADESVQIIANNMLANELKSIKPIKNVITHDSKETETIQICDLLLGAVMEAWQRKATSPHKLVLQEFIAEHLGWPDLRSDTYQPERKFNIWYFHDKKRGPREVKTRDVILKYPLP